MSKMKLKIKPLFVFYIFICVYFGWFNNVFYYVLAIFLHEYGHFFVAKLKGYEFDSVVFNVYGAGLYGSNSFKRKDDIIISLAGPMVNIILIILTICFWWIFPSIYFFTYDFVICNLVVMIFNILPFYPLDGGRVIVAILEKKFSKYKIIRVSRIICIIISCVFGGLFLISLFFQMNLNLLFISLFMTMNGIYNDNNIYDENIKCLIKKYDKPMEVKTFVVSNCTDKRELVKYISPHYYSIFEIKNKDKIYKITESDLIDDLN